MTLRTRALGFLLVWLGAFAVFSVERTLVLTVDAGGFPSVMP